MPLAPRSPCDQGIRKVWLLHIGLFSSSKLSKLIFLGFLLFPKSLQEFLRLHDLFPAGFALQSYVVQPVEPSVSRDLSMSGAGLTN